MDILWELSRGPVCAHLELTPSSKVRWAKIWNNHNFPRSGGRQARTVTMFGLKSGTDPVFRRLMKDFDNTSHLDDMDLEKVTESFLWYTFGRTSEKDLKRNLKEFKSHFKNSLLKEEYNWLESKVIKDSVTKEEYKKRIQEDVKKKTDLRMKGVQKTLKEMKLDKESWKKMLKIKGM